MRPRAKDVKQKPIERTRKSPAIGAQMSKQIIIALYIVAMIALIVGVDVAFLRDRFWARLMANIGIVLVFAAFYWSFIRRL